MNNKKKKRKKNFPFACLVELKKSDRLKLPHLRLVNSLNLLSFFCFASLIILFSMYGAFKYKIKCEWISWRVAVNRQHRYSFAVLHSSTYAVLPVCDRLIYSYICLICGWVINNIKPRLFLYLLLCCTCNLLLSWL